MHHVERMEACHFRSNLGTEIVLTTPSHTWQAA